MMREGDVAGRCCVGRGWWCAMACVYGCDRFQTYAVEISEFNQVAEKIFYAIWGLWWHNFSATPSPTP